MTRNSVLFVAIILLMISCGKRKNALPEVQFQELKTGVTASFRGLAVVSEDVIWASGSKGTVLLSTDGGKSWNNRSITEAAENDFRSIHAFDDKNAIVFGVAGPAFAYKTNNGGKSWQVVYENPTKGLFFNSVKFADSKNGLAVSDPIDGKFFVLKSKDGGNSWQRIEDLPAVEEGEANFAASNTCIDFLSNGKAWIASGGMAARIFYSDDFGESWKVTRTPMIRGLASAGIFSVSFQNGNTGIVVGGIYDQPELNANIAAYTFDGGRNWLPADSMPKAYRSCVQFVQNGNKTFAFTIGKTGCDISTDSGKNWNFVSETGYYTFRAVPQQAVGFAAGAKGKLAKIIFN